MSLREIIFGPRLSHRGDVEPLDAGANLPKDAQTIAEIARVSGERKFKRLPTHALSKGHGAKMLVLGQWKVPSHYAQGADTHPRQAIDREVSMVRNSVGVCDVSALALIELLGDHAEGQLISMCVGKPEPLEIGRLYHRYLSDQNGFVVSDTIVSKSDEKTIHITTPIECDVAMRDLIGGRTPANCVRISVNGPKARAMLECYLSIDLNDEVLPQMRSIRASIGKGEVTIQRVSFTGENGYELIVPTENGEAIMRDLIDRAEALGGGLFGYAAREVLRIEKGHLSSREMDGRVKAENLGLADLLPDTLQLVGLRPCAAVQKLLAGSVMLSEGAAPERENIEGHVSSVCYSPTIGKIIGLAFVKNGCDRMGEKIRAVDLVRDFDTLCEIVEIEFLGRKEA